MPTQTTTTGWGVFASEAAGADDAIPLSLGVGSNFF